MPPLLGGSTISAVMREWTARGLVAPQGARRGFTRKSVTMFLRNPRLAGLKVYRGEMLDGEPGESAARGNSSASRSTAVSRAPVEPYSVALG